MCCLCAFFVQSCSLPEEFLHFLLNGKLTAPLVKFFVKVLQAICRSVNHKAWPILMHGSA